MDFAEWVESIEMQENCDMPSSFPEVLLHLSTVSKRHFYNTVISKFEILSFVNLSALESKEAYHRLSLVYWMVLCLPM